MWNVGTLPSGGSGTITLVARPDPALLWSLPVLRTNWVQILSKTGDPALGNNAAFADVNIIVPTALAITASPPVIRVSNGTIVTTLRITVTDSLANLVDGVPIALSTTAGTFPASGAATLNVTTTNGVATASLASSTTVTTATVTASVIPAGVPNGSVDVFFAPGLPFAVTSVVVPTMIEVCGAEAVVTATVRDQFGNLVADGTNVTFNVVQGPRGDMFPRLTTTVGGIAVSTVRTKSYLFGERFLDVYILASREAQEAGGYQRVDLKEGPPAGITMKATPSMLQVNGKEATVEALVLDCGGNKVVNGTLVTFTANGLGTITPTVAATVNGYAYSVFKSFCQTGTGVVTATSGAAVSALNIPIEPGPADHIFVDITPDTISNCGGRATVEATVYDVCNNLVKDGTLVLFAPQYGYVSVTPVLAVTRNGKVTATAIADRNKMLATWPLAQEQIDVTSGSAVPGFDNLTITPGAAAKVDMSVDPAAIPINGDVNGYDIIVSAMVKDCSNTPVVDGTAVDLRTSLGLFRESGSRNLLRNTVNGLVTATLTSQSIAGSVVLTGTAGSAVGSVAARFLPGEPWMLEVDAIPETIFANGRSTTLIAARVKDEYDNPVLDGITVTLVADYGFFSDTGTGLVTRTTDTQGYVFATLVSDTVPRTVLVRAIAYNDRQGYTYVFFIEGDYKYLYMPNIRKFSP